MPEQEHYLDDGLFASYDGWQIKLRAPRDDGDHEVFMEGAVFDELLRWARERGVASGGERL